MTYAMANRFHEASEGSLGRVKSWEKDAMAEIFEEIKHRIVLRIKKPYESRNLSESQWEDYKRAKLNPNPSMFDRVYYYVYTFIGGRK
jgi:hypothetical protein